MSVIQQQLTAGNLKRWYRFSDGTLLDLTQNGSKGVVSGTMKFNGLGMLLDGIADSIELDDLDLTTNLTIIARIKPFELDHAGGGNEPRILEKNGAYSLYIDSGKKLIATTEGISDTSQTSVGEVDTTEISVVGTTLDSMAGERKLYIDGALDSTNTGLTGTITENANNIFIGSNGVGNFYNGIIAEILVFNSTLTDTEVSDITDELNTNIEDSRIMIHSQQNGYYNTDDSALLCALEYDVATGDIEDLTGRGNDATITGTGITENSEIGKATRFASSINYATIINPETLLKELTQGESFSMSTWYQPIFHTSIQAVVAQENGTGTGRTWLSFFEGIDKRISSYLGGSPLYSDTTAELYHWYHIVVNYLKKAPTDPHGKLQIWINGVNRVEAIKDVDEGGDGDINLTVSKFATQGAPGWCHQTLIFNRGLLQSEIEALYNKGVVQFLGGYGINETGDTTTGYLDGSPFRVDNGTFKINSEVIDNNIVKVIECVNDGIVYADVSELNIKDTDLPFGTHAFYFKKAIANTMSFQFTAEKVGDFIATDQNSYGIEIGSNEAIALRKGVAGIASDLFKSITSYVDDEWYGIKITNSPTGELTGHIKGGSYGEEYTLISPISVGSNPITDTDNSEGRYTVIKMQTGDKIIYSSKAEKYSIYKNLFVK